MCRQFKEEKIKKSEIKLIYSTKEKTSVDIQKNIRIENSNLLLDIVDKPQVFLKDKVLGNYNHLYGTDKSKGFYDSLAYIENKLWYFDEEDEITKILQKNVLADFGSKKFNILMKRSEHEVNIDFFEPCTYEIKDNNENTRIVSCADHIRKYYQHFLSYEDSMKYNYMLESDKHHKISTIENIIDKYFNECKVDKYKNCISLKSLHDKMLNDVIDLHTFKNIINYTTQVGFTNNLRKFLKDNNSKYETR